MASNALLLVSSYLILHPSLHFYFPSSLPPSSLPCFLASFPFISPSFIPFSLHSHSSANVCSFTIFTILHFKTMTFFSHLYVDSNIFFRLTQAPTHPVYFFFFTNLKHRCHYSPSLSNASIPFSCCPVLPPVLSPSMPFPLPPTLSTHSSHTHPRHHYYDTSS